MSQRGFTLIEMAMVFVLIGLMVGGGLFALAPVIDKSRMNQTSATLDQVENALELFAIRYSRLPCPADGSLAATDPNYGLEQPAGGATTCTITGATDAKAVIPWRTLGIDESYSIDAWATRLSYWPSGSVTGSTTLTTGTPLTHTGSTFPTSSGTYMTVVDVVSGKSITPLPPPATTSGDQAAYVLVSHGKSRWYGWSKNGVLQPALRVTANKACNSSPNNCALGTTLSTPAPASFASGGPVGSYPPSSGTYFDDIIRWRSPAMIIQLCGSGSCGNS